MSDSSVTRRRMLELFDVNHDKVVDDSELPEALRPSTAPATDQYVDVGELKVGKNAYERLLAVECATYRDTDNVLTHSEEHRSTGSTAKLATGISMEVVGGIGVIAGIVCLGLGPIGAALGLLLILPAAVGLMVGGNFVLRSAAQDERKEAAEAYIAAAKAFDKAREAVEEELRLAEPPPEHLESKATVWIGAQAVDVPVNLSTVGGEMLTIWNEDHNASARLRCEAAGMDERALSIMFHDDTPRGTAELPSERLTPAQLDEVVSCSKASFLEHLNGSGLYTKARMFAVYGNLSDAQICALGILVLDDFHARRKGSNENVLDSLLRAKFERVIRDN